MSPSLHTQSSGPNQGRTAVLLHSSGLSGAQWRPYLVPLHESGWQTITLDFIGYGESPPWGGPEPFDHRTDVAAVVDVLRTLEGEIAVIGHSYGGMIGMQALLDPKSPPARALVYEPVTWGVLRSDGDGTDRAFLAQLEASGFFDEETGGNLEWMRSFVTFWNGEGAWKLIGERGQAQMMKAARKTFEEVRSLCYDETPLSAYSKLRAPVHVIGGRISPAPIQRVCALLSALPEATYDQVDAGHMGAVTHSKLVLEQIIRRLT